MGVLDENQPLDPRPNAPPAKERGSSTPSLRAGNLQKFLGPQPPRARRFRTASGLGRGATAPKPVVASAAAAFA